MIVCAEQLIFSCSWWSVGNLSADLFVFLKMTWIGGRIVLLHFISYNVAEK